MSWQKNGPISLLLLMPLNQTLFLSMSIMMAGFSLACTWLLWKFWEAFLKNLLRLYWVTFWKLYWQKFTRIKLLSSNACTRKIWWVYNENLPIIQSSSNFLCTRLKMFVDCLPHSFLNFGCSFMKTTSLINNYMWTKPLSPLQIIKR